METKNIDQYLASMKVVEMMYIKGLVDVEEFYKVEGFIADKYRIKPNSIYRSNHLLFKSNRVIDSNAEKEV